MSNFGYDLWCTDDLTLDMREVDGVDDNVEIVAQSVYRRLITPRGMLIDDPDYGFDVRSLLHKGMKIVDLRAIPGNLKQEILKEERIEDVDVQIISADPIKGIVQLLIHCTTDIEPFDLTISVSEAAAKIISSTIEGLAEQ